MEHMGTRSKCYISPDNSPFRVCHVPDLLVVRCGKVHVQSLAKCSEDFLRRHATGIMFAASNY